MNPFLSIDKVVVSITDADGNVKDPTLAGYVSEVNDIINYTITVTNNGNQTLTNVVVEDPLTGLKETILSLAVGASQEFPAQYTLTQPDLDSNGGGDGDIDNTASADSDQTNSVTDSEAAPIAVDPFLSIDKVVASITDADGNVKDPTAAGYVSEVGDIINYKITVTNLSLIHI